MKVYPVAPMPEPVAEALEQRMHNGLRALIKAQWSGNVAWEVGDQVRFMPPEDVPPYYPPCMPFRGATGVVDSVISPGCPRSWACVLLADGRKYAAPMCWLEIAECDL